MKQPLKPDACTEAVRDDAVTVACDDAEMTDWMVHR